MMCVPVLLSAQNGVSVTNLAIDAGTVTFSVRWDRNNPIMPAVWSDSVWVFVDYNDNGTMKRLPVTGATLTETSAPGFSRVESVAGNDKGVWVIGNAKSTTSGSFSATVQLCTDAINRVSGGACAYASNYPPVARFTADSDISFTGTPNYDLTFAQGGNTFTLPSGGTYLLPADYTLLSFVDATGAPGMIISHVDYCLGFHPGVVGGIGDPDPSCALYAAGVIGGEGFLLPGCALYVPGAIGGAGDAAPSCATYRTGTIGGLSFVGTL